MVTRFGRGLTRQQGATGVLMALFLFVGLLVTLLAINVGNAYSKRDLVQDAAEILAQPVLVNQLSYRYWREQPVAEGGDPEAPDTRTLVETLATEAALAGQLGGFEVEYVFGLMPDCTDSSTFEAIHSDDPDGPDPGVEGEEFNAVALELRHALINLGGLFEVSLGTVRGRALACIPPESLREEGDQADCPCNEVCGSGLLTSLLCSAVSCLITPLLNGTVSLLLDTGFGLVDLLRTALGPESLGCVLEQTMNSLNDLVVVIVDLPADLLGGLLGDGSLLIEFPPD